MPEYGPLRDAPNPIQRLIVTTSWAASVSVGIALSLTTLVLLGLAALDGSMSWLAVLLISAVTLVVMSVVCQAISPARRMSKDERGDLVAPYLRWFRSRSKQAEEGDRVTTTTPADGTPADDHRVALGDASNPIQRLAVTHPFAAQLLRYATWAVAPALIVSSRYFWFGLVLFALVLCIGLFNYVRGDLRHMTPEERAGVRVLSMWPLRGGSRPDRVS